mgnify:CR=1 FL=1
MLLLVFSTFYSVLRAGSIYSSTMWVSQRLRAGWKYDLYSIHGDNSKLSLLDEEFQVVWEARLNGTLLYKPIVLDEERLLVIHKTIENDTQISIINISSGGIVKQFPIQGVEKVVLCIANMSIFYIVYDSGIIKLNICSSVEEWRINTSQVIDAIFVPSDVLGYPAVMIARESNMAIYDLQNASEMWVCELQEKPIAIALSHNPALFYTLTLYGVWVVGLNKSLVNILSLEQIDRGEIAVCDLDMDSSDDAVIIYRDSICWHIMVLINYDIYDVMMIHSDWDRLPIIALDDVNQDGRIDIIYENITISGYGIYYERSLNVLYYDICRKRSIKIAETAWYVPSRMTTVDLTGDKNREFLISIEGYQSSDAIIFYPEVVGCDFNGTYVLHIDLATEKVGYEVMENRNLLLCYGLEFAPEGVLLVVQAFNLSDIKPHNISVSYTHLTLPTTERV